jgi:hypothetical protein
LSRQIRTHRLRRIGSRSSRGTPVIVRRYHTARCWGTKAASVAEDIVSLDGGSHAKDFDPGIRIPKDSISDYPGGLRNDYLQRIARHDVSDHSGPLHSDADTVERNCAGSPNAVPLAQILTLAT